MPTWIKIGCSRRPINDLLSRHINGEMFDPEEAIIQKAEIREQVIVFCSPD